MSSAVKSESLQLAPALREVGTGRSRERDGEDPGPGTPLFTAAGHPAAPPPTAPDLTSFVVRFQSHESRLSRLEHTSVDDASLASLQDHLLKVERRLDQLQAKQAEQAPVQDADQIRVLRKEVTDQVRKSQDSVVSQYHLGELPAILERVRRLEQRATQKVTPETPDWVSDLPRRIQRLEHQLASQAVPALPEWLPALPARLRQLELKAAQPHDTVLPDWVLDVPRRLKSVEARVAAAGQTPELPEGVGELPRRVRRLERSVGTLTAEGQQGDRVEATRRIAALERRVAAIPADKLDELEGLVDRLETLESSMQVLDEATAALQQRYREVLQHLEGTSDDDDEEDDDDYEEDD